MIQVLKICVFVLVALLAATFVIDSDWEVSHQVSIDGSRTEVWDVLVDLERYPEWNRYSPNVRGKVAVGEIVWVEAHLKNEVRQVENVVTVVQPYEELCWQSQDWYAALAQGTRCRRLSTTADGMTQLIHHEVMSGPLAWLIEWVYRERIERGLKLVDDSLKAKVESLASG